MKAALLFGVNKREKTKGLIALGVIQYNPVGQEIRFISEVGFENWECELQHNSLGLQDRRLPEGHGLRITPISGDIVVTFTDEIDERNFLLDPASTKRYRELFE